MRRLVAALHLPQRHISEWRVALIFLLLSGVFAPASAQTVDICSRTAQVEAAILAAINSGGGTTTCDTVTAAQLSGITALDASNSSITSLQAGDFAGLGSLEELYLYNNQLSALPEGVFAGLGSLELLGLNINQLSTLPEGVFAGLSSLEGLWLHGNQLSTLPEGVFAGLGSLEALRLESNQLSALPEGVFAGLSSLEWLFLNNNPFTRIPAGEIPASVTRLWIDLTPVGAIAAQTVVVSSGISVDTSAAFVSSNWQTGPRTLSYDVTSGDSATATATVSASGVVTVTGVAAGTTIVTVTATDSESSTATQDIAVTVNAAGTTLMLTTPGDRIYDVQDATISDLTLPVATGGAAPYVYTLTPTAGALPAGLSITGSGGATPPTLTGAPTAPGNVMLTYRVTDSSTPPVTVSAMFTVTVLDPVGNFCARTPQVQAAILARINSGGGTTTCATVTASQLAGIELLDLVDQSITSLQVDDFAGLSGLEVLRLDGNQLRTLPEGVFAGLAGLEVLDLGANPFTTLPEGVFAGLTRLGTLKLGNNQLTTLPEEIFAGLTRVSFLDLDFNNLMSLPERVFAGLDSLEVLFLNVNQLTTLPEGIFAGLASLSNLRLQANQLTALPEGVFAGLAGLDVLILSENQLTDLPEGVFAGLTDLGYLYLEYNLLTTLPEGIFAGLNRLERLDLYGNPFTRIPAGVIPASVTTLNIDLTPVGTVAPQTVAVGGSVNVDLSAAFISSGNDMAPLFFSASRPRSLSYTVTSGDSSTATATVSTAGIVTVTGAAAGDATIAVTATDTAGGTATQEIVVTVNAAGVVLALTAPADQTYARDVTIIELVLSAATGGTAPYVYTLTPTAGALPAGLAITGSGGGTPPTLTGAPTAPGSVMLTYRVTDSSTLTASDMFTVTVPGPVSPVSPIVDVCSRTEVVRVEILASIGRGVTCDTVTASQLSDIRSLSFPPSPSPITSLQAGDFAGLANLDVLILSENQLTALPEGVFAGLTELETLDLGSNQLMTLPEGVFTGLTSLETLYLENNQLTTLPEGIFAGLARLERLDLEANQLTTLPSKVFDGLISLELLDLDGNPLTRIPAGAIPASVTTLYIDLTPVGTVAAQTVVAGGSINVDTSAAFISSSDEFFGPVGYAATSSDSATATVTASPAGVVTVTGVAAGGATITVIAIDGTNTAIQDIAVTVNAGASLALAAPLDNQNYARDVTITDLTLPAATGGAAPYVYTLTPTAGALPEGLSISGSGGSAPPTLTGTPTAAGEVVLTYSVADSAATPVTVSDMFTVTVSAPTSAVVNICSRTLQVQAEILARIFDDVTCDTVTASQLSEITSLSLHGQSITSLRVGDFAGLDSLEVLTLWNNQLTTLSAGVFEGLDRLERLELWGNQLTTLPAGIFDGLNRFEYLSLDLNPLIRIPAGVIPSSVTLLGIDLTPVGTIAAQTVAADGSANVDVSAAFISSNTVSGPRALSYTVTSGDGAVATATVSAAGLVTVTGVAAGDAIITVTAMDSFDTATQDVAVTVSSPIVDVCSRTPQVREAILAEIGGGVACDAVTALQLSEISGTLDLSSQSITSLQSGDFAGLASLEELYLGENQLSTLPAGGFAGLTSLEVLLLFENQLETLTTGVFAGMPSLEELDLGENRLTTLPAGGFAELSGLTGLYLDNNQLTTLSADVFTGLDALEELSLNENSFAYIPADAVPASVTRLNIDVTPVGTIAAQTIVAGNSVDLDLSGAFISSNERTGPRALSYAVASDDSAVATATVSDAGLVTVTGVAGGAATIGVTAMDGTGRSATQNVAVTVMVAPMLTVTSVEVAEDAGTATVSVTLNVAVQNGFTVDVSTMDGSATTAGADYEAVTAETLTFAGNVGETHTLTITINDDNVAEGDETLTVSLGNLQSTVQGTTLSVGASSIGTVAISDNEMAGFSITESGGSTTTMDGGTDTFTVVLDSQPTASVTITATSSNPAEGLLVTDSGGPGASVSLVFDSGNWDRPQTVTVDGAEPGETARNVTYQITIVASSSDSHYNDLDEQTLTVNSTTLTPAQQEAVQEETTSALNIGTTSVAVSILSDRINTASPRGAPNVPTAPTAPTTPTAPTAPSGGAPTDGAPTGGAPSGGAPSDSGPSGGAPAGDAPSGGAPSGDAPSGDAPSGSAPSGDAPSGDAPSGDAPSGDAPSGDAPSGDSPSGDEPSGNNPSDSGGDASSRRAPQDEDRFQARVAGRSVSSEGADWKQYVERLLYDGLKALHRDDGAQSLLGNFFEQALSDSGFTFSPFAADKPITFWGSAGAAESKGNPETDGLRNDFDSSFNSVMLGIDSQLANEWLLGLAASYGVGDVDYTVTDNGDAVATGGVDQSAWSVHPYFSWSRGGYSVWWFGGYGEGENDFRQTPSDTNATIHARGIGSTQRMMALGVDKAFTLSPQWDAVLRAKGLWSASRQDAGMYDDNVTQVYATKSITRRGQLESEAGYNIALERGSVRPYALVGVRWDSGDVADKSAIVDAGGGILFAHDERFFVDIAVRKQVSSSVVEEQSLSLTGSVIYQQHRDATGLTFSLKPAVKLGGLSSGWNALNLGQDLEGGKLEGGWRSGMKAELAYGRPLRLAPLTRSGTFRSYSRALFESDRRRHAVGFGFESGALRLELEGGYEERGNADGDMETLLKGEIKF